MNQRVTSAGTFVFTRSETAKSFTCDNCGKPRVSKNTVEWTDKQGTKKTICNGCYGQLVAKG